MKFLSLWLAGTTLVGCLDPSPGDKAPAIPTERAGSVHTDVALLDAPRGHVAIVDWGVGPESGDAGLWTRRREVFAADAELGFEAACDSGANPYRLEVHVVGVYAVAPDHVGAVGAAAPDGAVGLPDLGVFHRNVDCEAGRQVWARFDIALFRPAQQGFIDSAINADAGAVGDAVWDLQVVNGGVPPAVVWGQRITASTYGDSVATCSYVAHCDAAPPASDNTFLVQLVGLYAEDVTAEGHFGAPAPTGALEVWPPPRIERPFTCVEDRDVFVQLNVTLARGGRDPGAARGGAGASCPAPAACSPPAPGRGSRATRAVSGRCSAT